jgi:hypothetical protein
MKRRYFIFQTSERVPLQKEVGNDVSGSPSSDPILVWCYFQCLDNNGVPKREDLLKILTRYLVGYENFKAHGKIPGFVEEEVRVSFTVCNYWLNHAHLTQA